MCLTVWTGFEPRRPNNRACAINHFARLRKKEDSKVLKSGMK